MLSDSIVTEAPEDLGIKLGTKTEVWWTQVKEKSEQNIFECENMIKADTHLLKLANKVIAEEENNRKV